MRTDRRRHLLSTAIGAVALFASACAESSIDGVRISDAWARPTPTGADVAAVYFRLESGDDDRLVSATVDRSIAGRVELHSTTTDDSSGAAQMRPLDDGVKVDGGATLTFEPGGNHVMLIDLPAPLIAGAKFGVTIELDRAGPQLVDVTVRAEAP